MRIWVTYEEPESLLESVDAPGSISNASENVRVIHRSLGSILEHQRYLNVSGTHLERLVGHITYHRRSGSPMVYLRACEMSL